MRKIKQRERLEIDIVAVTDLFLWSWSFFYQRGKSIVDSVLESNGVVIYRVENES